MLLRSMGFLSAINLLKAVASFAISICLVGVIEPAEFGLVSFSLPLMLLVTLLTDLGLASALIRRSDLPAPHAGAARTLLLMLATGSAGLLAAGSGGIHRAGGMHGLQPVLVVFSLVAWLSIAAVVPKALLERRFEYSQVAAVEISGLMVACAVFVALILARQGLWALLGYHLAMQTVRAIGFVWHARGQAPLNFQFGHIVDIVQVGGWVMASNLLAYASRNVDRFIIGSVLGAGALGLYGMAYQFMTAPLMLFTWPVSGVVMNVLARGAADGERRTDFILAILGFTALVSFPLMALLTVGLDYPVAALLKPAWKDLPRLVSLLCLAGAAQSVASFAGSVLVPLGSQRLHVALNALNAFGVGASCWLFAPLGLEATIVAYTIQSCCVSVLMVTAIIKTMRIQVSALLRSILPGLLIAMPVPIALALQVPPLLRFEMWILPILGMPVWGAVVIIIWRDQLGGFVRELAVRR